MKYLLVLGASSDIAKAVARKYAKAGFHLFLAGRREDDLERDGEDYRIRYGVETKVVRFDALDVQSHARFYESLSPAPDGVVCAVGILGDQLRGEKEFSVAKAILDTNFLGCVSILNIVANDFERRRGGFIVGISSVAGDRGRKSNYLYGSAKAGFSAYLSGLRNRLAAAKVQVLTVKPGLVATRMTEGKDLPKLLTAAPADVANDVFRAQQHGKDSIYTPWYWRWIMLMIRFIPESKFKKLSL